MKKIPISFLFLLFLFTACNNNETKSAASENDIDAARNFIRAALDGNFNKARVYLLADSLNTNYLDVAERSYQKIDGETKNGYRSSSINIHLIKQLNDSTSIVIFSNSYKNDHDTLRILKQKEQWLVDLKYLYNHDSDTLFKKMLNKDSIK